MCKIWVGKKFIGQGLPSSIVFLINILGFVFEASDLGTYKSPLSK